MTLLVFGGVITGLFFFINYAELGQAASIPTSAYPPPITSPKLNPYPPPSSSPMPSPIPSPTVGIIGITPTVPQTIPNSVSLEQAAKDYISSQNKIAENQLIVDESFTVDLPLSNAHLWSGWVVDSNGKQNLAYQVMIDSGKRIIITGSSIDQQTYWSTEEALFGQKHQTLIINSTAAKYSLKSDSLKINNGVLHYFPITGRMVWEGKIFASNNSQEYEIALNSSGVLVEVPEIENSEISARAKNTVS